MMQCVWKKKTLSVNFEILFCNNQSSAIHYHIRRNESGAQASQKADKQGGRKLGWGGEEPTFQKGHLLNHCRCFIG